MRKVVVVRPGEMNLGQQFAGQPPSRDPAEKFPDEKSQQTPEYGFTEVGLGIVVAIDHKNRKSQTILATEGSVSDAMPAPARYTGIADSQCLVVDRQFAFNIFSFPLIF